MKEKIKIRTIIQIFFILLVMVYTTNHVLEESGKAISWLPALSIHAICPFGGVETFFSVITLGVWVKKVHASAMVLMVIILLLTLLFGPVLCSFICPLGSLQEWIGKLGKKILRSKYNRFVPKGIDKCLRFLRYITLLIIIYLSYNSLKLVFDSFDPYSALFHFWTGEAAIGGIIVLVITLVLSLFVERPWCKYACPYGALLGLFNKIRIFKITRKESNCINCGLCSKVCPMNIDVEKVNKVTSHQCISCMECTSDAVCPIDDTVYMSNNKKGD